MLTIFTGHQVLDFVDPTKSPFFSAKKSSKIQVTFVNCSNGRPTGEVLPPPEGNGGRSAIFEHGEKFTKCLGKNMHEKKHEKNIRFTKMFRNCGLVQDFGSVHGPRTRSVVFVLKASHRRLDAASNSWDRIEKPALSVISVFFSSIETG